LNCGNIEVKICCIDKIGTNVSLLSKHESIISESRNKHHLMIINTSENIFINYYYEMLGKPKITHASKQLKKIRQIMSDPTSGISKFSKILQTSNNRYLC